MAVKVLGQIEAQGGKFKPVESVNVGYTNAQMQDVNDVKGAIDYLYNTLNQAPVLSYVNEPGFREGDKKYWALGDAMRLVFQFSSSAAGKVSITVLRNGFTFKTLNTEKGLITIDLGIATSASNYVYTVSAVDSLGRSSSNTLTFTQISGGVTLTSTFDAIAAETVFSVGNNDITIPASISYAESNFNRYILYTIRDLTTDDLVLNGEYSCGTENWSSQFTLNDVELPTAGNYELTLQGKVTADETLFSSVLTYTFSAISVNTIAVTTIDTNIDDSVDNITSLFVKYRIVTNIAPLQIENSLQASCKIYRGDQIIKTLTTLNLSSGNTATWNIGRLPANATGETYQYEIHGQPAGGGVGDYTDLYASGTFVVTDASSHGSEYVTSGLICYFDPNDKDNSDADPSIWKMKNAGVNNYYYFKLHDLNYSSNGWVVDPSDESKMLKFTGDSYGELRYVNTANVDSEFAPMSNMGSSATGNSLEIMFRTRCIGETDAVVMSCRNEKIANYGGYTVKYDMAKISSNQSYTTTTMVEDEWTHVVFVIDKNLRQLNGTGPDDVTNRDIEDMNPVYTMNIYINGVRTKVVSLNDSDTFVSGSSPAMQLLLNAYKDTTLGLITGQGACEIKTIRLYNKALKASEVLVNYINANYSIDVREALINKNDNNKADIPVIRFVRNKVINGSQYQFSKYSKDKSFEVLNSITIKSSDDPDVPTSKNSWVNCTVWYTYLDKETNLWTTKHWNDVDVYLQGTSSLQYPIKNYKIKLFNSSPDPVDGEYVRGKKLKVIPWNMKNKEGWYKEDSTFTLKCDYMEESHKNNTPTASFYETVVDKVIDGLESSDKIYTPAKDNRYADYYYSYVDESEQEVSVRKYRDAIAGFPVLLYYNENNDFNDSGIPLDYNDNAHSSDEEGYFENSSDIMVGTLMFNVDKTGSSLGFDINIDDASEMPERISGVKKYTSESEDTYHVISPYDSTKEFMYTDGTLVTTESLPCISLEGTSNSAVPSAASFYTMEEANLYIYKNSYLEELRQKNHPELTIDEYYTGVQNGTYTDADNYTQYKNRPNNLLYKDEYDYIKSTFEVRWAFTEEILDEDKLSKADYNELTFGHIKNTLDWVSSVAAQPTEDERKSKFRDEFRNHFSFAYAVAYYLQMQAFIQVDNAGKNAMFDEWGDGVWFLRPYDMDTQMGENNSGDDVIHSSAEINRALSPCGITGNDADQADVSNRLTDAEHTRYIDYNTPNSRLWNYFGSYFKQEIQNIYYYLRGSNSGNVYSVDYIVDFVNNLTSDVIGESFYNKDAASKYLTQTYYKEKSGVVTIIDNMLSKLQGNRDCRYRQICADRFKFLDSFFSYTSGDTTNTTITMRSDSASTGVYTQQIGISVYNPCYITVAVGTDVTIVAYVEPGNTYTYNNETLEGVLFTLPIKATNKDITIVGAGNIKSINHMENLLLTNFDCANASKITSIVIPNSTALASLSLGSNTYLRTLNVNGSSTLSGSLSLTNCANLKYINIANTDVSSISLPENGSLVTFIASNTKLTSLEFNGLTFLNDIQIDGCTDVASYVISNCPKIQTVNVSGYIQLNRLVVSNCPNVSSLQLTNTRLSELSVTMCDQLKVINLTGCSGTIMTNLNLTTIYGLEELNISSSRPAQNIKLFLPLYDKQYSTCTTEEIQSLIDDGVDVYWHNLKKLTATDSYLSVITYGINQSYIDGDCDFQQLNSLTNLKLSSCIRIINVKNLMFSGSLASLFSGCYRLQSVSGELTSTSTSISSIFNKCTDLQDISSNLMLNLDMVTDASSALGSALNINYTNIKYLLSNLPNVTSLSSFLSAHNPEQGHSRTTPITLESNMFENNTKVTSVNACFYYQTIKSVPSELFSPMQTVLSDAGDVFLGCTSLTTVPQNIFKGCVQLKNLSRAFYACTSLKNIFTGSDCYNIFAENSLVENTSAMFYGCSAIVVSTNTGDITNGLKRMFDNLPNLKTAYLMFSNTKFVTNIPNLMLSTCTKLENISMMFRNCTSVASLPNALFSDEPDVSTTTHSKLTNASGLFSGCTSLTGQIRNTLLGGATELTNIGAALSVYYYSAYWSAGGMFANTKIDGYESNFLSHLTKLTSVSFLFFKGSAGTSSSPVFTPTISGNNNSNLTRVYIGNNTYLGIYNGLLSGLTKLTDVRYLFAGNISLSKIIDDQGEDVTPSLFDSCKNTLRNAEGVFANCTSLSISVPNTLFKNCSALTTLRSVFAGCTSLEGDITTDLLSGCSSLVRTDNMFYGCSNVGQTSNPALYVVPSNLFDSCRNTIANVEFMFAGTGLGGQIQTGDVEMTTDEQGITQYTINRYGLLSECVNLTSTAGMFKACYNLHGKIPDDIFFTRSSIMQYNSLTNISEMFSGCYRLALKNQALGIDCRNKRTIYGTELLPTDNGYLIPTDWVNKCPALQNIESLFKCVSYAPGASSEYQTPNLNLEDSVFRLQIYINNASCAFACVKALNASLTADFMQNSLNNLQNVSDIFAFSNLQSAGSVQYKSLFEKSTSDSAVNTTLTNITRALYHANNNALTGYGLTPQKFSALSSVSGYANHQTQLSNFSIYEGTNYDTNPGRSEQSYAVSLPNYSKNAVV